MQPSHLSQPSGQSAIIDAPVVANLMNEHRFGRMMVIAETMASASLIPDHLLGKKVNGKWEYFSADEIRANCFLIVNQSFRWGMDPFAVMPETYVVGGKLGYQGKLIAGLVNSLADLEERLSYEFSGTKGTDDFTVKVSGKFRGAPAPVSVEVSVGQAKTDNQMWKKDPEQKLVYTGATKWARRWCPEIILGILTDDDADAVEMREAKGHVVSETVVPKVVTGAGTPTVDKPARGSKKTSGETDAASVVDAPAEPGESVIPPRPDIVAGVRTAFRAAGFKTLPAAEAQCIEKGFLPRGKSFSDLTDPELFVILQKKDEIFPVPTHSAAGATENPAEGGDQ